MTTQSVLDASSYTGVDPQDMAGAILGLPEQVDNAVRIASAADVGALAKKTFSSLVIAGLGGSAIGGDLFRATYEPELTLPVTVVRDYHLPGYTGEQTLVYAASNSGNTEETLAAYASAQHVRAGIVAFSTGGKLSELARQDGVTLVTFPGGLQPRAALGYSLIPLIVVSAKLGLIPQPLLKDIDEASAVLRAVRNECAPNVPLEQNPAKRLASGWKGKLPVIYGSQGERGVVAYRWKTQIEENAKAFAVSNVFPELNHNETVGWSGEHGQEEVERSFAVTILRDDREPKHIRRRVELTKEIIARVASSIDEVWARGQSALSRMLSLVYMGDWASYYLAIAYGQDPTPVRVIDWLKSELAKS
ncbi:MAG: bifunctional phosphoglucose/phosphomannose isomerase [Candidatus Eremiobacteraeota bacterium]|nr:bifunctional phosphoglucose/phosphomannose isomerase [Candidatus Eremiobacteraeota bacterium]MBV8262598.1 bifunctional phosphoglucose/phosphomannose isomerase [Candidatus Eremiobacteraeota bacterium]MBV8339000.1 bifunctional phosphoglucose/phosphomannose isomerase [Candidatus Eremiobacteraeota bacterium]MBV8595665.1 bifunctional phosphoglucose/phosphomannose isomerase [Candidatus Eremiobacteraeota bacterium]MBV8667988.1 bifunctional phosphoglucose/phosphomannose isomerase [Candidatus Eremiob